MKARPIASLKLGTLSATLAVSGVEVSVHLRVESDPPEWQMGYWRRELSVQLRTMGHPLCELQGQPGDWCLESTLEDRDDGDVLRCAYQWAIDAVAQGSPDASIAAELAGLVTRAADEGIARCDHDGRELALGFDRRDRWQVYAQVVGDRSGRTGQLASVCPGLVAVLCRTNDTEARRRAASAIVAGRRLPHILDQVADLWLERVEQHATSGARLAPIYRRSMNDPRGARALQRAAWRRADTGVSGEILWLPFPPSVVIDDVPRTGNSEWFRAIANVWTGLRVHQQLGLEALERLAGFLSAHFTAIRRASRAQGFHTVEPFVRGLVDYAQATGRVPDRRSGPARVVRDVIAWHELVMGAELDIPPHEPLAPGPCARWSRDGLELVALQTARDLAEEGQQMHHCVASLARDAARGSIFVYRGRYQGERMTVAITRGRGRWELAEASGFANRSISLDARRALDRWLRELATTQQR